MMYIQQLRLLGRQKVRFNSYLPLTVGHFFLHFFVFTKTYKKGQCYYAIIFLNWDICILLQKTIHWLSCENKSLKPWPNGVASSRKLRTWVYLRLRLARTCVHLRWLARTCAHFGWDQICTQVDESFSPYGHPIQVNASPVTSINLLLANEIEDSLLWNVFIRDLRVLARKLACPFGHPTQVSTQVQLASTCDYLLVRLTWA